jgi:hypothetical protein
MNAIGDAFLRSRPFEPWVSLLIAGLNLAGLVAGPLCMPVRADGGLLRFSAKKSGYQISVFTAPTPIRVGTVDISAFVQDASTGNPIKDVRVTIRMTRKEIPALESPATTEAATNKLFRAAQLELPAPGRWQMQVQVQGPHGLAVIGGDVDVAEALPRWRQMWPWIGWPALVIALFGIHQILIRRRAGGA